MQFPLIESRTVLLSFKIKIAFWCSKLFKSKRFQFVHDELPAAQNLLCKLAEGTLNVPSANLHK